MTCFDSVPYYVVLRNSLVSFARDGFVLKGEVTLVVYAINYQPA